MGRNYKYDNKYEQSKLNMSNPARRAKARVGFKVHLLTYIGVMSMLWVIAFITGSVWYHPWPIYPMMGWGFGLVGHYFAAYQKYDKWLEREMGKEGVAPPQYLNENVEEFELRPLSEEKVKPARDSDFI